MTGKLEADALERIPELQRNLFPYRGHEDFRGWTEHDTDCFSGGLFIHAKDDTHLKWIGGAIAFVIARRKLEELGYTIFEIKRPPDSTWHELHFNPKSRVTAQDQSSIPSKEGEG